jgi:hypothetical protein
VSSAMKTKGAGPEGVTYVAYNMHSRHLHIRPALEQGIKAWGSLQKLVCKSRKCRGSRSHHLLSHAGPPSHVCLSPGLVCQVVRSEECDLPHLRFSACVLTASKCPDEHHCLHCRAAADAALPRNHPWPATNKNATNKPTI